jgi:hypothetical protein
MKEQSSLPLFTVVADALGSKAESNDTVESEDGALYSEDSDDDDSLDYTDEDDPIMSLIRESESSKPKGKPKQKP